MGGPFAAIAAVAADFIPLGGPFGGGPPGDFFGGGPFDGGPPGLLFGGPFGGYTHAQSQSFSVATRGRVVASGDRRISKKEKEKSKSKKTA